MNEPAFIKTLDEWIAKNAKDLEDNLATNVKVYCENLLTPEEQAQLVRLEMIMVRQWAQEKGIK